MMGLVRRIREGMGMDGADFLVCITLCSLSLSKCRENSSRRFLGNRGRVAPHETDSADAELSVLHPRTPQWQRRHSLVGPPEYQRGPLCVAECVSKVAWPTDSDSLQGFRFPT
jgi:hypothetical protein